MKKATILCVLLFLILLTTSLLAQGAWHPEKTYWPRTLIDSSDAAINVVRDRITIEPYDTIYAKVVTASDIPYSSCSMERDKARVCRCAAFRYLMENDIAYADTAKEYLLVADREYAAPGDWIQKYKNILWDSEIISMISIAYDCLKGNDYDFGGDEATVCNQIKGVASSLYYDLISDPNPWAVLRLMWENGFGEEINYGVKFASAMGMAAIVLNTETSGNEWEQPQTWINYSMNKLHDQFHDYLVDEEGGWAEGAHYQGFSAFNFIPFAISHCNFVNGETELYGGISLPPLLLDEQLDKNAEWGIRIRMPNGARPNFDDCFLNPYYFNGFLAGYLDNDLYAWDYIVSGRPYFVEATSGNLDVEMICAYDNSYTGATGPDFSPTQFLPSSGQAVFRSGWDQDAVYMCLLGENGQARTGGRTHEHPDNTSFIIYAYGELLAMDCGYVSWDKRDSVRFAENHSLILVDGDGPPAAGASTSEGTDAFIENFFDTDKFDYAEVSTNYQGTDFRRCVAFIDDSYFVIADFVDGLESHTYDWLLHGNGGGTTGNGFSQTANGSVYSVNDVDLNFFIYSTEDIALSNYDDYHDGGVYDSLFTHTVTKANVNGSYVLFSSFLVPGIAPLKSITYTPINLGDCIGGTIERDNEKTISLIKYDSSTVSHNFFSNQISFDGYQLIVSRIDEDIPKNIFLNEGQNFTYKGKTIINSSIRTDIAVNIGSDYADGYVATACTVNFFTGNEPNSVTGGSYSFSSGITTVTFSEATNFEMDVVWSFDYGIDDEPNYGEFLHELKIYPNPFAEANEISFTLSKPQKISIEVFNLKGQKVTSIINDHLAAGDYVESWNGFDSNGNQVANGIYLYKINYGNGKSFNKKVNLLR